MRIFAYLGEKGGNRIVMKFCIRVGVPDVITNPLFFAKIFKIPYYRNENLQSPITPVV